MASTSDLMQTTQRELNYAKQEICSPADNRILDICDGLLEVVGRLVTRIEVLERRVSAAEAKKGNG